MVSAPPGRGRCGTRSFLCHFCDNIAYLFSSAGFCTTRCETDDKTIIIRQGRLGINVTEAQENGVFLCVQVIIGAAVGEEMPVAPRPSHHVPALSWQVTLRGDVAQLVQRPAERRVKRGELYEDGR